MKLLIFISSLSGGGAERVTANLANHWAGMGWKITVVTLAPYSLDSYELHPTVKRISLDLTGESGTMAAGLWQNLRRVMVLRRVIRNIQPDIALGMMTSANVLISLAAWGLPQLRAIGSERTHPPQYPMGEMWEWLRRHSYKRLAAVTALTRESAVWLTGHTSAQRVSVIPNAAFWPLPMQKPRITPESLCQSDQLILLGVGRVSEEKQFGMLLEVFHSLANQYPSWNLVILGEGPQRSELQVQVRMVGLEQRVFFPGRAGNVSEWYERADLYVLSSRFEGFPNSLVEAMAHGLASVSFDCDTGPRDIIRHETDGLLVPPGDAAGLAAALERLMGDSDLRERFAERAADARERFSIEKIVGMWEELFEEVAK